MNKKEAASLLVSGLAVAGGVLSASLTGGISLIRPEILSEGLKAFGGVGGNLVANALQTKLIDSHPQDDVLKNGDLTRAIGNAIFKLCGDLAKDTIDKNDKKSLEKLSQTTLETWENLILGGEYEEGRGLVLSNLDLDEVSAEKSVQYVKAQAANLDEIKALTPQSWQNVIETLCRKNNCALSADAKTKLAEKLYREFARALRKVLIDDFSKDGKAFASMQFRIFGEILTYTQQNFLYAKEAFELSDSILPIVIDLSKKVDEINRNLPKNYSVEHKEDWKPIFAKFDSITKDISEILEIVRENSRLGKEHFELEKEHFKLSKEQLELIKEILENQKNQSETKSSAALFLPKNFPASLIYFTGREKVLEKIAEALKNHGTAAFADTHGVGKSSVIIEFAYRNQINYKHILFIRATNNEFNIYVSDIIKDLGFDLPEDAKPEERLAVLQEWLAKNQDWLLLVDNVDDVDFIHKCGFNKPNGKVIYTSNNDKIFKVGTKVELPKLNDKNAMLLLYKHWQDEPDAKFEDIPEKAHTALKGIAKKFDNHPFSMAFVGSYLAEEDESLEEFLEAYQSKEKNLLEKYKFLSGYQHENVAAAFLLRFEQISTPKDDTEREQFLSIAVKDYLKLSAFVGTDNIPEELLQQSLAKLHPDQAEWTENKDFIRDIYKRFKPTSIFKRDAEKKTLTTHRIVQEIMRFQIKDEEDLLLETLALILISNSEHFNFTNKEKVERYLIHIGLFLEYLQQNKIGDKANLKLENQDTVILSTLYGRYFMEYGQYKKAEKYFVLSIKICENNKNLHGMSLCGSYHQLSQLYYSLKNYKEAESLSIKSLAIKKKILGETHVITAASYNDLALIYTQQGKHKEAEPLYMIATLIYETELGENHIWTATNYSNLAAFYIDIGNFKLAKEYQEKSLKSRLAIFGEDHPDIAGNYQWLGRLCLTEKKFKEALDYFYKAHGIFLKFLPEGHPILQDSQTIIDICKPHV